MEQHIWNDNIYIWSMGVTVSCSGKSLIFCVSLRAMFVSASGSHFGGVWECQSGTVRKVPGKCHCLQNSVMVES